VLFVSQSSSQNDICFVIPSADERRTVEALRDAFAPEIAEQTVEHVSSNSGIAIVAVVGENMHGIPGVAGRTFSALGREGINIIAIAQGSSEYNISLVVEAEAMQHAMLTLHREFRLHEAVSATRAAHMETRSAEGVSESASLRE
jgi:aspartate kinase